MNCTLLTLEFNCIRLYTVQILISLMDSKPKYIALLAILPLFVGVLLGSSIVMSEAQSGANVGSGLTERRIGPGSPGQFGMATSNVVCGDRLCGEPEPHMRGEDRQPRMIDAHDQNAPTAELISVDAFRPSTNNMNAQTHVVTYRITAGMTDLEDIHVDIWSDMADKTYTINSLPALSSSVQVARIRALDSDSLNGEITGWSLAPPTGEGVDRTQR